MTNNSTASNEFVLKQVDPAVSLLGDIINLNFVPYGFAEMNVENHTVVCEHGEVECKANSYQQCAVHYYATDPSAYMPFITCLAMLP